MKPRVAAARTAVQLGLAEAVVTVAGWFPDDEVRRAGAVVLVGAALTAGQWVAEQASGRKLFVRP